MGNFVVAIVILSAVMIFTAVNSVIICNLCDEMIDLADKGEIERAKELWQEKKGYLGLFIRDAEIDVVTAELSRSEQSVAIEDGEAEAAIISLKDALEELKHSECPQILNIF